jgi:phosphoglycolate phosphatase
MKVILFDIDGTLIRCGGAGLHALLVVMREEFGVEDPQPVPVHGCTDQGIVRELFHANGVTYTEDRWSKFMGLYLECLESELTRSKGHVLPGVKTVLESLRGQSDLYLGLLTGNVKRGAEIKLDRFGLRHYFRGGGFGDHHPLRDDVARAARKQVEEELGQKISEENLWVVGDTPADVQCGRAIGARVVAVCTGGSDRADLEPSAPDFLLNDLTECQAWFDEIQIGS